MENNYKNLFDVPILSINDIKPLQSITSAKPILNSVTKIQSQNKNSEDEIKKTIFVGNVPIDTKRKSLFNIFKKYGEIDSIRFRSVPTSNLKIPKKAQINKKEFSQIKANMIAYIKFKNEESAINALELNNFIIKENHLRVDRIQEKSSNDYKNTIFIGNLPFIINEEEIRNELQKYGTIVNIRIVRDKVTYESKGIAYVQFKTKAERQLAQVSRVVIKGRELRIKKAAPESKIEKKKKRKENIIKAIETKIKNQKEAENIKKEKKKSSKKSF